MSLVSVFEEEFEKINPKEDPKGDRGEYEEEEDEIEEDDSEEEDED